MLRDAMLDAARRLVSARTVVRHQQKIGLLARLWYHALTTGLGTQTLGEEYCDLHQTDAIGAAPSSFRRVALVLLEALAPVVLKRARARARRVATRRENDDDDGDENENENEGGAGDVSADERRSRAADAATARTAASSASPSPSPSPSSTPAAAASGAAREARWTWTPPNARALLARALRRAARAADDAAVAVFHPPATRADGADEDPTALIDGFLPRAHLAAFYLWGTYYAFAKRIAGVRYVFVGQEGPEGRPRYGVLGVFLAARLAAAAAAASAAAASAAAAAAAASAAGGSSGAAFRIMDEHGNDVEVEDEPALTATPAGGGEEGVDGVGIKKCALCLSSHRAPTATACGHVFCWHCVAAWCARSHQPECPMCRAPCKPQELVRLANYF